MFIPSRRGVTGTLRCAGPALVLVVPVGLAGAPARATWDDSSLPRHEIASQKTADVLTGAAERHRTQDAGRIRHGHVSGAISRLAEAQADRPDWRDRTLENPEDPSSRRTLGPVPPPQPPNFAELGYRDGIHSGRLDGQRDARSGQFRRSFNDTINLYRLSRGGAVIRVPDARREHPEYQRAYAEGYALGYEEGYANSAAEGRNDTPD